MRKIKIFQKGFNYSQDGRGNRLILHLQGCNMKCPWCSNPEGMHLEGTLLAEKEWLLDSSCPKGAVRDRTLFRESCRDCRDMPCIRERRQKGLRFSCREYEIEEILQECIDSVPMFFDGGGVTLTGGEITMQFEAVKELLERLGEHGIHRAIESNGTHPKMADYIPLVEQWIMDVKHYDDVRHKYWTGVSNKWTIENLKTAAASHPDVLVRIPLIPGFNDSPKDAEGFARLLEECIGGTSARVEFLEYHEFGKGKWEQCGREYKMPSCRITPGTVTYFEKAMREHGITCIHT